MADEEELENASTNFKFIPWKNVATSFDKNLLIDITSYSPRRNALGIRIMGLAYDVEGAVNAGGLTERHSRRLLLFLKAAEKALDSNAIERVDGTRKKLHKFVGFIDRLVRNGKLNLLLGNRWISRALSIIDDLM